MGVKLRTGFVGVGGMGIANYHARNLQVEPSVELVACCDIQPEATEAFGDRFKISNRYTSYEDMLEKENLDIVVICTSEIWHAPMTIQAAKVKPKAIICEKPMAMNLAEADAMLTACAENDVKLIIGHQRRYMPQYARAKELLDDGAIGTLEHIWATGHPFTSLMVDGTHTVDLMRFYADDTPIQWVIGQIDARSGRMGHWKHVLEDASLAMMKFESGVRGLLTTGGWGTPADPRGQEPLGSSVPFEYNRILLQGSKGMLDIRGDSLIDGVPLVALVNGQRVTPVDLKPGDSDDPVRSYWHRGLSPHADLLQTLSDGTPHLMSGESARATLEVLMAIYESSRLRELISLPLTTDVNPLEQILAERGQAFLDAQ